eukprot:CAMPEP_0194203752 /NCGR_PEP_ID=MMETSP0156-20130528/3444_1 /TAXON_ID=33649 /ORGANISM="Thalassionema nitzschioides, Strain L26-B" /LENGTH=407 /DNA_ID=CAMNT_0038929569 /DNA_START=46 /DNA_END=1269 /DNA_ORIENTATION=-
MRMTSTSTAHHSVQVAVIGAGVLGLAVARAISQTAEVLLLERHATFGSETSSRHSEVIHAGLYYPTKSWKAKWCVKGKELLYHYCRERHIPFQNCGKLIVATTQEQWKKDLPRLQQQALRNGVTDVTLINKEMVQQLEPNVSCVGGALWSPSTGVLDSQTYMTHLLADAEADGSSCTMVRCSNVTGARFENDGTIVLQVDNDFELHCKHVINCAGLQAAHVAQQIHSHNNNNHSNWTPPRHYFAKGNYFRLQGLANPFTRLIYPLPEPGGLGVHATIDWSGTSTKFGPNVEWLDPNLDLNDNHNSNMDGNLYCVSEEQIPQFEHEIRKYWPDLPKDSLVPDYAGIRPKLHHPSLQHSSPALEQDFYIAGPKQHHVAGLYHLLGIESPGLTSSMAIADYIAQQISISS